jgi:hypothetical protein
MRRIGRRLPKLSSLLAWIKGNLARFGFGWGHNLKLGEEYRLGSTKVRVPLDAVPIEITLGLNDRRLHLYRENRLDRHGRPVWLDSFIIVDPRTHMRRIGGFLRLTPKSWLALGSGDETQQALFDYPSTVDEQHMVVIYGRDALVFRNLSDAGTAIAPVVDDVGMIRVARLRRLREILGGPVEALPPDQAQGLIEQVNRLMRSEAYRSTDERGLPGGLLALPRSMLPIVVADMHGQVDNLLTVLAQNAFLDMLEEGCAALVILGDAVHSEVDGQLHQMESSMMLMDLIFRLKLCFPSQVFYIRGNHDSFSEDLSKDGIPQGLLWAKELCAQRGTAYLKAMQEFYDLLPYVVVSPDFAACHAAPPTSKVSRQMLVDIHRHPGLMLELTSNRLRRPNRPLGYSRRDVKRFRRALHLDPGIPLIVGHTPIDGEGTVWLNVDGIANHHVLFSANPDKVGVFVHLGGRMIPLIYPVDALTPIINALT